MSVPVSPGSAPVEFSPPDIREEDIEAVVDVLRSGWITTGPVGQTFAEELAAYCGSGAVTLVNSGTFGLETALRLLGIGRGDEVVTTAYTYSATAAAIAHTGAEFVLVDVEPGSFVTSVERLLGAVTERTKAVVPVDIGGVAYDSEGLADALAGRRDFTPATAEQGALGRPAVVADAAHSLGAARGGRRAGALADFTVFSFHAVKNLTTAEGGALTWRPDLPLDPQELARQARLWTLHGQTKDALAKSKLGNWAYDVELLGHKGNMPDVLAALGLSQLRRYEASLARRHELVAQYDRLVRTDGVEALDHTAADAESSCHLYLAVLPEGEAVLRDRIIELMAEAGVAANVHYKALPALTAYSKAGFDPGDFPHATALSSRVISLPLHNRLTDADVTRVAETFHAARRTARAS